MNLFESVSDIVFHSTRIPNLISILKTNQFVLSTSMGTQSDKDLDQPGYHFYMSLSNVKESGYDKGMSLDVKLVLDGRKLNHNYKSKPVEYWGSTFHGAAKEKAEHYVKQHGTLSRSQIREITRYDENESRLYNTKSTIPNAKQYIKEIHILFDDAPRKSDVEKMVELAGDIPLFGYADKETFSTLNKKKAISLSFDSYKPEPTYKHVPYEGSLEYITALYEWCSGVKNRESINTIARSYGWDKDSAILADIHNQKKNPKVLKMLEQVSWYMRKNGLDSIGQVIKEIVSFNRKLQEDEYMEFQKQHAAKNEREQKVTQLDEKLTNIQRAFYVAGDADPYTYGGILFFRDEAGRIEAVAIDDSDSDTEHEIGFTRISYEDPRKLNWVNWDSMDASPNNTSDEGDLLQLFADAVRSYGVENFGSYGYEKRSKANIMLQFPTKDMSGEEIMREIEAQAIDSESDAA